MLLPAFPCRIMILPVKSGGSLEKSMAEAATALTLG